MQGSAHRHTSLQRQVFIRFWPLATLVLLVFVILAFISGDRFTGTIHTVNLIILSVSVPLCLRNKWILFGCNLLAFIGMVAIITFLFTGGPAQSGFWWSIVYVVGAFLVTPKRWAIFWLSLYLLISVGIVFLSQSGAFVIAYTIPELLHLLFVYVITSAFVYHFNKAKEYYLRLSDLRTEELARVNKELLSANKELEDFAYVASHDLQEPIQTISNFTGLLAQNPSFKPGSEEAEYFNFISEATSRMKTLIQELLELSRIGRKPFVAVVDCNRIVKDVLFQMESSVKGRQAKIVFSSLPLIEGNPTELKQLFLNLMTNALKFSKKNTKPLIEISARETGEEYLFAVNDNGIGFDERYASRIFVIFQRLHSRDEYPGTGIGLATCKKVVDVHGGRIWAESLPGEGSTFYFTLPKTQTYKHDE